MADLIPPMLIQLQADVSQLKVGLAQAESAIKGVDQSVQTASTGMTNFIGKIKQVGASLGIAFAGTQVLQFGRDVIQQAQEAEAQQQRLYQLMKVGTGATDEQIASLNAQAEALQKVGVVTAGNITQTQSQLATFNLQTDTIKTLTPAILDYVTAEKGANASADEFKQMTNGLAQALNGNFGSLTRVGFVLDDHTKKLISSGTEAERAAAITDVLNSTYKDFNKELRNTPEGRMQVLRNDFNQLKEDLGKKLLPALKIVTDFLTDKLIPGLRSLGKFFKDNSTIIITLTGAVIAGAVAWKTYQTVLILTSAATKAYAVVQTLMRTGQLASIASTNGLAASMLKLNAIMRANPIGVIVTAIALLATGFVIAYKKSETFRNGVAIVAKAVISYVAFMIRAWGDMITIIMKVVTGPLKLLLTVMDKLKVPGAKQGLAILNGAIEGVGNFAETTAKKVEGLKGAVDKFTKSANESAKAGKEDKGKEGKEKKGGGGGGLTDEQKKKLTEYKKDVANIYKDMNEVIADSQEKAQEELNDRNEKMFKAHENYDKRVADLNKRFREVNLSIDNAYNKKVIDIRKNYLKRTLDLEKDLANKIIDLRERAAEKSVDLRKSATEKELSIVQQSMDRLRNAFASQTGFNIDNTFGPGRSVKGVLTVLKRNLTAAQELQANAGALAGMGYSQTFIEEVIKQGPKIGNNIAKSLKNATPESTAELQKLLSEVQNVSEHGLDGLAKSMNTGGKLATEELTKAYAQVAIDLKASLAGVDAELQKSLAEANAAYQEAMTEAQIARDEALQEAFEAFKEARAEAQKDLDEGLADAQETLLDALLEAQKDYEKAIDNINKSTMKKLQDLKDKLKEVAIAMEAVSKGSSVGVLNNAPKAGSIIPQAGYDPERKGMTADPYRNAGLTVNNNITTTQVDPYDVHLATLSAIKYGNAVTVAPSRGANPLMKTGVYSE
jgi:hypothetical protein